ncbi:MAG: sigma-70 family RNA polymerase sigma factor [Thermomicrobiales bacterium]
MNESAPATSGTEALLIARAQRDPTAFAPLYESYFDAVYRYCHARLGDAHAAEDAASTIFTRALIALPRFRPNERDGSFRSWLFTIAHNVVVNQYRDRHRHPTAALSDAEALLDGAASPEEAALSAEMRRSLYDLLAQLTDEQRRVVELRLAGLTDKEIASVLGRNHGAVRAAQYRAVVRLRALFGSAKEEPYG